MPDHLREQILDTLVGTKLTGLATTATNVFRFRGYAFDESKLPCLNILQGADTPTYDNSPEAVNFYLDHQLEVDIEIRVKHATDQLDETLNQIDKEITIALQADETQGLGGVYNTVKLGTTEPFIDTDSDKPVAMMVSRWRFDYRVSRTDPSVSG